MKKITVLMTILNIVFLSLAQAKSPSLIDCVGKTAPGDSQPVQVEMNLIRQASDVYNIVVDEVSSPDTKDQIDNIVYSDPSLYCKFKKERGTVFRCESWKDKSKITLTVEPMDDSTSYYQLVKNDKQSPKEGKVVESFTTDPKGCSY